MCVYVFMCLCVDVFVYLWKAINVDLWLYGIMVLWLCVNPLSSLSVPFVIHSYVHMILFARSLRADRQNAILRLHSRLYHCTMGYKRIETACTNVALPAFMPLSLGLLKHRMRCLLCKHPTGASTSFKTRGSLIKDDGVG